MDLHDVEQITDLFARLAAAAKDDPRLAAQVRDALAESGLLAIFGSGESLDVVDLLDAGGEDALRARLEQMTLSELKSIVAVRGYDADKETARWRSPKKFVELIVERAAAQLEKEVAQSSGASWML
ncbi:MAG TPA: hypothetical protein VF116_16960 [Ktedonobacterales bacterium]